MSWRDDMNDAIKTYLGLPAEAVITGIETGTRDKWSGSYNDRWTVPIIKITYRPDGYGAPPCTIEHESELTGFLDAITPDPDPQTDPTPAPDDDRWAWAEALWGPANQTST